MATKPIKVIHIIPQIGIGGAETQLHALISRGDGQAVEHAVLYYSNSLDTSGFDLFNATGVSLSRVPRNKKHPIRFLRELARAIDGENADIVHCWLFSAMLWGRVAALIAKSRHIVVSHRSSHVGYDPIVRLLDRLTMGRVHYLANSRACARIVAGKVHVPIERFDVIPNGVAIEDYRVTGDRAQLMQELKIPDHCRLAVHVGRLTLAKNHEMLLRLARRCKDVLPLHFVMVGHGERYQELLQLADQLGVADIVHFLGLRRDIPRILKSSDLFCFTSTYEGFPNALLEAMAAGLPIVTTNFAGADELVEDGENGVIVDSNDIEAAFKAIQSYLADPEWASRLGHNAHCMAEQQFSMDHMIERTIGYYRRIMAEA